MICLCLLCDFGKSFPLPAARPAVLASARWREHACTQKQHSGNQSRKDKKNRGQGGCHFLFVPSRVLVTEPLVSFLLLGHSLPLGSLADIYSAMEGRRRRRRAHGVSFTITWKFPARSRMPWTLYPAPALIPAVPREKKSVTEQINVCCFLSRPDRPLLTGEGGSHSPCYGGV